GAASASSTSRTSRRGSTRCRRSRRSAPPDRTADGALAYTTKRDEDPTNTRRRAPMLRKIKQSMKAWWRRNVVADDPNPEYSRLDRMDGLGSLTVPEAEEQRAHMSR